MKSSHTHLGFFHRQGALEGVRFFLPLLIFRSTTVLQTRRYSKAGMSQGHCARPAAAMGGSKAGIMQPLNWLAIIYLLSSCFSRCGCFSFTVANGGNADSGLRCGQRLCMRNLRPRLIHSARARHPSTLSMTHDDSGHHDLHSLQSQMQLLEYHARMNAEHHSRVEKLRMDHERLLHVAEEEHEVLKKELLLRVCELEKTSDLSMVFWEAAIDSAVEEFLQQPAESEQENIDDSQAMTPTAELSAAYGLLVEAGRKEAISGQGLSRAIFALRKFFDQKPATRYFDPRTDGMQMGHKAEIDALKRKIADDSRKHSELKEQLSTALSVLVDAQEERDRLQVELDRRDAIECTEQQRTGFPFRSDKDAAQVHGRACDLFLTPFVSV